jgi:hypothetical protein
VGGDDKPAPSAARRIDDLGLLRAEASRLGLHELAVTPASVVLASTFLSFLPQPPIKYHDDALVHLSVGSNQATLVLKRKVYAIAFTHYQSIYATNIRFRTDGDGHTTADHTFEGVGFAEKRLLGFVSPSSIHEVTFTLSNTMGSSFWLGELWIFYR